MCRTRRKTKFDHDPNAGKNSKLFAKKQAHRDTERQRRNERSKVDTCERHARIGKAKDRYDKKCNGLYQRMLQPVEW